MILGFMGDGSILDLISSEIYGGIPHRFDSGPVGYRDPRLSKFVTQILRYRVKRKIKIKR